MNQIIQEFLETYRHNRRLRRRCRCAFIALAVLVIGGVIWQMKQPGISLSETLVCPLEEHQHTEECYTQVLVCELNESDDQVIPGHQHTEECYKTDLVCTCEIEEHVHGEECFDETGALVCTHQEHTHSMGCYDEDGNLTCTFQEHSQTEECYDEYGNLTCTLPEHTPCFS